MQIIYYYTLTGNYLPYKSETSAMDFLLWIYGYAYIHYQFTATVFVLWQLYFYAYAAEPKFTQAL
jgi:hypothetical protein